MAIKTIFFSLIAAEIFVVSFGETSYEKCTSKIKTQLENLIIAGPEAMRVSLNGDCTLILQNKVTILDGVENYCSNVNGTTYAFTVRFTRPFIKCMMKFRFSEYDFLNVIYNTIVNLTNVANQTCPNTPASNSKINTNFRILDLNTDQCAKEFPNIAKFINMNASRLIGGKDLAIDIGNAVDNLDVNVKINILNKKTQFVNFDVKPLEYGVDNFCSVLYGNLDDVCTCLYNASIPEPFVRALLVNLVTCHINDASYAPIRNALTCDI